MHSFSLKNYNLNSTRMLVMIKIIINQKMKFYAIVVLIMSVEVIETNTINEFKIEIRKETCKGRCISKCCPKDFIYSKTTSARNKCVPNKHLDLIYNGTLKIYRASTEVKSENAVEQYTIASGIKCAKRYSANFPTYLQENGNLYVDLPAQIPPWLELTPDRYCIDTFLREDQNGTKFTRLGALVCFSEVQNGNNSALRISCMLVSCVFIVATVCVYLWLPELRNLHGAVLATYLLCLCAGFAGLAVMQILLMYSTMTVDYCVGLTFLVYFFLESAFFWLNVMCYDIWWTFCGRAGVSSQRPRSRYHWYALYAFGLSTLLTILLVILELTDLPRSPWLPMIRRNGCFINGPSKVLYLYGPIIVLCLVNIYFFMMTALKIAQVKRMTSMLKSKESATHNNNTQKFYLYLKLFVVMGINWILEVASAILSQFEEFWRYVDFYNLLIGPIVFIMFVCKKKIFQLLKKKFLGTESPPTTTASSYH